MMTIIIIIIIIIIEIREIVKIQHNMIEMIWTFEEWEMTELKISTSVECCGQEKKGES